MPNKEKTTLKEAKDTSRTKHTEVVSQMHLLFNVQSTDNSPNEQIVPKIIFRDDDCVNLTRPSRSRMSKKSQQEAKISSEVVISKEIKYICRKTMSHGK